MDTTFGRSVRRQGLLEEMSGTVEQEVIVEALEIIDRGLAQLLHRELLTTTEAADILLDLRSLLAGVALEPPVPVAN